MTDVDIHDIIMIPKELLETHPRNSNKQNRHVFRELRKSIRENGFDETLIVAPKDTGSGYVICSGNHRYKAGVAEGMDEFPCVVRDDWDSTQQQIELVRRNYVRGKLDRDIFTVAVDVLAEESGSALDDIREQLGFEDPDLFLQIYKQEEQERVAPVQTALPPRVKMVDDMGMVLSGIFENFGDTVDKSFIIFPAGGRKHLYIAATPALRRMMELVAQKCIAEHIDINLVLGGLLVIGMENCAWKTPEAKIDEVVEKGSEDGVDHF